MVVVDGLVDVGERLRLDALAGVDHQQRALAGGERAVDLVGEIDVAGRVDQVEDVVLAVARLVVEADGLRLDGDAALALDVHGIEHLLHHLALLQPAGELDQPVGERRFAVVDVGDDREIADVVDGGGRHGREITPRLRCGKDAVASRPQSPRPQAAIRGGYRSSNPFARAAIGLGVASTLATICCIFSPSTGSTSKFSVFGFGQERRVLHGRGKGRPQRREPLGRDAGVGRHRPAELGAGHHELDQLAILGRAGQRLDRRRVEIGRARAGLGDHRDLLVLEPGRLGGFPARPGVVARLDLAAFHREVDRRCRPDSR